MENTDIRWQQRFANYKKALTQLTKFIDKGKLNELEVQGLIQSFEYTFELAWKVLKDYLELQGYREIIGSKGAFREAFSVGLIAEEAVWGNMLKHRNLSVHCYDEAIANEIADAVAISYFSHFLALQQKMQTFWV
jgi:nucleotidyltransferase substrate binding protein (TIGR01987 family)